MSDKNNKSGLRFLQLNNYVKPKIKEDISNNWVLNGRNNSYFTYVNDRNIGSPTNSAINNGYKRLIYGKGLAARDQSKKLEQYARLKSILKPKDVRRIVNDFQVQGMAYFQILRNRDKSISSIEHIAVDKIAPEIADENNNINAYYFSNDWSKWQKEENKPIRIPAFGSSKTFTDLEIFAIRPYQLGMDYFALPTYQSSLQYSELEEEISNYSINHMKNGLSFGYIINIPDSDNMSDPDKDALESKMKARLSGSDNAGTAVLNFQNGDKGITVEPIEINDAHKQWNFLSEESQSKILVSHEVVSPMLFGIKDSSGFSSNADELDISERQTVKRVVNPKQNEVTEPLEEVLLTDGITLDLYFKPLTEEVETVIEERTTELSKHICLGEHGATEGMADTLIQLGENESEEWRLLCSSDVDYATDDDIFGLIQFATSTGTARPNAKSGQDSEDIKIRYRYVGNKSPERGFCLKMMGANKLYRKEDILQMNKPGINDGFGKGGADSYSIWLWKGGGKISDNFPNGTCKHKWQREIYLKVNGDVDVNSPLAETITTSEARRRGYKVPVNDSDVSIAPHNNK